MALARLFPDQKVAIEPLAFVRASGRRERRFAAARGDEFVELRALVRDRRGLRLGAVFLQPFFGGGEARPARQRRAQIGLAPFGMTRRFLKFREPREESFNEFRDPISLDCFEVADTAHFQSVAEGSNPKSQ